VLGDVNAQGLTECPGSKMRVSTAETMTVVVKVIAPSVHAPAQRAVAQRFALIIIKARPAPIVYQSNQ
jgi:hypothetical protein